MLETIRNQVAKENAFDDWEDLCFCHGEMTSIKRFENLTKFCDEVAKRYVQSQTQELIEQNAELVSALKKILDFKKFQREEDFISIKEMEELLTKHNHLKSNTNGSI